MKESVLLNVSIEFSVKIVEVYKKISIELKENTMSKQMLRSGTSIGANIHETQYGNSRADFISKLHNALKETN